MTLRPFPLSQLSGRKGIPLAVLLVGLVVTATAAVYIQRTARNKDEIRFDGAAQQVSTSVATKVETYVALLRAGAGLFAASNDVSAVEFRRFVGGFDLTGRYTGIQGIGFAKHVGPGDLQRLVQQMQAEGQPGFAVWPSDARRDYFPIIYLEPLDRRNQAAIGYDMFTEPTRRAAMERAARTGLAAASGKVVLKQEIDPYKQAGFLLYLPTYQRGMPLETDSDRFAALTGFVYSPFRAGDFLEAVLAGGGSPQVDVKVYDGTAASRQALLFDSTSGVPHSPSFRKMIPVDVAGRPWLIEVTSAEGFEVSSEARHLPLIVLIGVAMSGILFWLTHGEISARLAAERSAVDLKRSEEALRAGEVELRRLIGAERRAHAEAQSASRAKDEFLATLSHELRTPLNAILGWATMLKGGKLSAEQEARAVEIIARNAQTQAQLIEDLLDVSRIITSKLRVEMAPATFGGAVQAALDAVRPTAEAKGVAIEATLATDGPVLGDADRLQQIAWNLLSNAIKFTPSGGRVEVSLDEEGTQAVLAVRDTGIGIDRAFLPHVFERFRQRDSSTTRMHGGMGLGLAIVWHLVDAHRGTIRAQSEGEGCGSVFIVSLPMRVVKPGEKEAGQASSQLAAVGLQRLDGLHVLVVDDEEDSREMLADALAQAGAVVSTAASAGDALQQLADERVDVLLADISMPETDGYMLMRHVRSHPAEAVRRVPAIAVTAHAREEDRQRAEEAGFQLHVAKPVDIAALRDAVHRLAATV